MQDSELTRLVRTNKMLEAQNKDLRNAADDADTELRSARPELATLRSKNRTMFILFVNRDIYYAKYYGKGGMASWGKK